MDGVVVTSEVEGISRLRQHPDVSLGGVDQAQPELSFFDEEAYSTFQVPMRSVVICQESWRRVRSSVAGGPGAAAAAAVDSRLPQEKQ